MGLAELTPEQRQANIVKANAARKAKQQARKTSELRKDFMDADLWEELARARGIRLAPWGEPCTMSTMHGWLRKLGVTVADYEEQLGRLADFPKLNPDWPARAWLGLVLEWQAEAASKEQTEVA